VEKAGGMVYEALTVATHDFLPGLFLSI